MKAELENLREAAYVLYKKANWGSKVEAELDQALDHIENAIKELIAPDRPEVGTQFILRWREDGAGVFRALESGIKYINSGGWETHETWGRFDDMVTEGTWTWEKLEL